MASVKPLEAASAPRLSIVAVRRAHAAPRSRWCCSMDMTTPTARALLGHADWCALGGIEQGAGYVSAATRPLSDNLGANSIFVLIILEFGFIFSW